MFNPDIQYRCTIIRGKAQKELDNLLPAYANIISEICPCNKNLFDQMFNDRLSEFFYNQCFSEISESHQKTIRNHVTEIAGKLFGLFFEKDNLVYESPSVTKLLNDNDQPAFFKNLCLNFQFPNGTQKIETILDRINNNICFKPFHFIISLLDLAKRDSIILTKQEIGYYILNAKEVLQGRISVNEVLNTIVLDRKIGKVKKLPSGSKYNQHIKEQLNLLELANIIKVNNEQIYLNEAERGIINIFINESFNILKFPIYSYDLSDNKQKKKMFLDWAEYFGRIAVKNISDLDTNLYLCEGENEKFEGKNNKNILGERGEAFVFNLEKERVRKTYPRLANKIQLVGKIRGLGYDILSVEADEDPDNPEFARFIEVKSTIRVTEPDLTDKNWVDTISLTRKEWISAQQYQAAYNIYRVYFTQSKIVVRKINNPFYKKEKCIIQVIPTMYRMDFNYQCIDQEY